MFELGRRLASWLETTIELLEQPTSSMPHQFVIDRLSQIYPCTAVGFHWRETSGRSGLLMVHGLLEQAADTADLWQAGVLDDCHPLLAWYAATGDPRPQTIGRVPRELVPPHRRILLERPLRQLGLDQQLSINYRLIGPVHNAFVVGRDGPDYSDDDLVLADYVRRTLVSLDTQVRTLAQFSLEVPPGSVAAAGLTGRELAVLRLLADGLWPRPIARRLHCSPRTVEKHVQRIYRKLGVRDRVNAVLVAQAAGILRPPTQHAASRGDVQRFGARQAG